MKNLSAQHSTAQHSTAQHSTAQHSTAQHSTAGQSFLKKFIPLFCLWIALGAFETSVHAQIRNESCNIKLMVFSCDSNEINEYDTILGHYISTCPLLDSIFRLIGPGYVVEYHKYLSAYNNIQYVLMSQFLVNNDSLIAVFSNIDTSYLRFEFDTIRGSLGCIPVTFNDPYTAQGWSGGGDWHIEAANFDCAWNITRGDSNLSIGFVDGLFSDIHDDRYSFRHTIEFNSSFVKEQNLSLGMYGNGVFASGLSFQLHGNKVAGIANATAGNNLGITGLTDCKAFGFDVAKNQDGDPDPALAEGSYLKKKGSIKILNFSMNASFDRKILSECIAKDNLICVLAGGNRSSRKFENGNWVINYDADNVSHQFDLGEIPGCIIVTGLEVDQVNGGYKIPDHISQSDPNSDRNYQKGRYLDVVAPSDKILTLNNHYDYDGNFGEAWATSTAAAVVTAAVALMRSVFSDLTGAECECIIKETAKLSALPINNAHLYPSDRLGAGRIDAYAAVSSLSNGWSGSLTSNQNITNLVYVVNDLSIPAGITMTIDGGIVRVRKGVKIIVEAGGKLILKNNALLTNLGCIDNNFETSNPNILGGSTTLGLWEGIYVKGPGWNTNYDPNTHGYVLIENSTIENAVVGIELGDGMAERGGILIMKDSKLKNCRYGAKFNPYMPLNGGINPSSFSNCEFICDKYLLDGDLYGKGVNTFIWANSVANISVMGCDFYNRLEKPVFEFKGGKWIPKPSSLQNRRFPFINGIEDRGRAIGTFLCDLSITPLNTFDGSPCVGPINKPCTFEGFGIAIHALGANQQEIPVKVFESQFLNNERNIYLVAAVQPLVIGNYIDVNADYKFYRNPVSDHFAIGIRLDNCFNFIAGDNELRFDYHKQNADITGIYTQNCGYLSLLPWSSNPAPTFQSRVINNKFEVTPNDPQNDITGTATFITGTNQYANVCNDYDINWDFGWYTYEQSVLNNIQAYRDDLNAGNLHYANNNFHSAAPCSGGRFSVYSFEPGEHVHNGTFHHNNYYYPYTSNSPWHASCAHQFTANVNTIYDQDLCPTIGSRFYSRNSLYCPGPDEMPGTADDGEGSGQGNDGYLVFQDQQKIIYHTEEINLKWLNYFDSTYADITNITKFGLIHFDGQIIDDEKRVEVVAASPNQESDNTNSIPEGLEYNIKFYPNPGNGTYNLVTTNLSSYTVRIINQTGQTIQSFEAQNSSQIILDAPSGIYLLLITLPDGNSVNRRFVHLNQIKQ